MNYAYNLTIRDYKIQNLSYLNFVQIFQIAQKREEGYAIETKHRGLTPEGGYNENKDYHGSYFCSDPHRDLRRIRNSLFVGQHARRF